MEPLNISSSNTKIFVLVTKKMSNYSISAYCKNDTFIPIENNDIDPVIEFIYQETKQRFDNVKEDCDTFHKQYSTTFFYKERLLTIGILAFGFEIFEHQFILATNFVPCYFSAFRLYGIGGRFTVSHNLYSRNKPSGRFQPAHFRTSETDQSLPTTAEGFGLFRTHIYTAIHDLPRISVEM